MNVKTDQPVYITFYNFIHADRHRIRFSVILTRKYCVTTQVLSPSLAINKIYRLNRISTPNDVQILLCPELCRLKEERRKSKKKN